MTQLNMLTEITPEILEDMRYWVSECEWREQEFENFDPWNESDEIIIKGVKNHFAGGLRAFLSTY